VRAVGAAAGRAAEAESLVRDRIERIESVTRAVESAVRRDGRPRVAVPRMARSALFRPVIGCTKWLHWRAAQMCSAASASHRFAWIGNKWPMQSPM